MKTVYVGLLLSVMCVCVSLAMSDDDRRAQRDRVNRDSGDEHDTTDNGTLEMESDPSASSLQSLRFTFFITDGGGIDYVELSVPAMELAVEQINANTSVLPNYELEYNLKEIECSSANVLDEFFQEIFSQNTNIAFIGNGCPEATVPTAKLVHRWNISQIAFSPIPNGARSQAPNLFSTYPSELNFVLAFVAFISQYRWRRVLVITQKEELFTTVWELLQEHFEDINISISNIEFENEELLDASKILDESSGFRVIFLNTYPNAARRVLCEAQSRGSVYPYYTWILYGWYSNDWWKTSDSGACSNSAIREVLERAVSIRVHSTPTDSGGATDTGFTYNQFQEEYASRLEPHRINHHSFIASLTYDAVWALAIALHHTDTMPPTTGPVAENNCAELPGDRMARLGQFDYSNGYLGCLIEWQLRQTNFMGVSGLVTFDAQGTRLETFVNILQYRVSGMSDQLELTTFASYNLNTNQLEFRNGESNSTVYPDGTPPDGIPKNVTVTFHLGLTITYYVIAAVGIVCNTACMIFNFKYRNTRVVKLTSPKLNYILIAGGYLMFFSLYPRLIPHTGKNINQFRCIVQNWMNVIAYCVAYGIILAKMGRVYIIFHKPSPKRSPKGIKDWHMVLVVALVTGIGVFLVTLETAIPQIRPKLELLPSDEHSPGKDDLGITINYYVWQCYGTGDTPPFYFLVLIFSYLCLLQFIGLVLAIKTRKVKINILNDSKYIAATIYVSSLVIVVMALVVFVSGIRLNTNEAFFSGGLLLSTFVFMGFTFIPKIISYYRDPHGERVLKSVTGTHHVEMDPSGALTLRKPNQERINTLERRVTELEGQLNTYKSIRNVSGSRESIENIIVIGSPATTLSDLSDSILTHGGSLDRANNILFDQTPSPSQVVSHYQRPSCSQVTNICHQVKKETTESQTSSLTRTVSIAQSPPSIALISHTDSTQNSCSQHTDTPASHAQYKTSSDMEKCSLESTSFDKTLSSHTVQTHSQGAEVGKKISFSLPGECVTVGNCEQ